MLQLVPRHWYSWNFSVMDGDRALAEIDLSWWREKGVLTVEGQTYRVYREGLMSGDFILESGGSIVARAEKPRAFQRSFLVHHDGRSYTLRAKSAFRRAFVLLAGSEQVGSVVPLGVLTRKASVDLPNFPAAVKVFVVWLTVIIWKRDSDAAAAGSPMQ
jgi:hypothetical protein